MPIHPRNADDEEMGELSELFAPDAFIGTVLDTDETEVTAEVVEAVGVDDIHAVCAEEGEPCDSNGFAGSQAAPLSASQASRLLVLMAHAQTCPGRHADAQHAEICRSVKFLMLHINDCTGYSIRLCTQRLPPDRASSARSTHSKLTTFFSPHLTAQKEGRKDSTTVTTKNAASIKERIEVNGCSESGCDEKMPSHPRNANGQETGELSELFAPDAFIGTVLDTEEMEVTAEAVEAVGVNDIHAVCAEEGEPCDTNSFARRPAGRLSASQASRLLVLMAHAQTCPGRHANTQHAEVCRSAKFLMLHINDCTGHSPTGEPCEYRWCLPCKRLLCHLARCPNPSTCDICTPLDLPVPLRQLTDPNIG